MFAYIVAEEQQLQQQKGNKKQELSSWLQKLNTQDFHSSEADMRLVTSPGVWLTFMEVLLHELGFLESSRVGFVALYICAMACTQQPF